MREFLARLRDRLRRRQIEEAFAEEMQLHLEELEARYRGRGLSASEARQAAVREFGNVTLTREDLRDRAGFPVVDEFFRDLRHAWRGLSHRPLFALGVVLVLAIGLGAASTLSSLTRAILFAPLPVPDSGQLYLATTPEGAEPETVSYGTVRRFDTLLQAQGGGAVGHTTQGRVALKREQQPAASVTVVLVTGNYFEVLRVAPAAGRLLGPADDERAAASVAVVAQSWAEREYGGAAAAVGREVWLNRQAVVIVGVVPDRFATAQPGRRTEFWLPAVLQHRLGYGGNAWVIASDDRPNNPDWTQEERVSWMNVLVRLPDANRAGAEAALAAAVRFQREDILAIMESPAEREQLRHRACRLVPAPGGFSSLRNGFRSASGFLVALVGSILVLACANVSGLLLVRTLARHRELGVRLALGSGRWRIARLALTEALILSTAGAAVGWLVSLWLLPALQAMLLPGQVLSIPGLDPVQGFVLGGLVLLCAGLCGVGPALLIARLEPLPALAGHGGLRGAAIRIGRLLVGAQLALAVVLVVAATTLGREIVRALEADPGFARSTVLTTGYDPRSAGYGGNDYAALTERLDHALRAVPGVADVGFAANGILNGSVSRSGITFRHPQARIGTGHFQTEVVRPGYFQVAGMALRSGRDLSVDDRAGTQRVAVVSAALARSVFGDLDPVGQRFGYGATASDEDFTIVGVVGDARLNGVRSDPPAVFYLPAAQAAGSPLSFIVVRTQGPVAAVQQGARAALTRLEPGLVFQQWRTLEERVTNDLGPFRAASLIATTFAVLAIVLAAAGVAASLGYLVTLRQREMALRIAIGADPGQIRRSVLLDAVKIGATGAALGLGLAALPLLFPAVAAQLPARPDLAVGAVAASVGMLVAVAAGWWPARRAARADLLQLLKLE